MENAAEKVDASDQQSRQNVSSKRVCILIFFPTLLLLSGLSVSVWRAGYLDHWLSCGKSHPPDDRKPATSNQQAASNEPNLPDLTTEIDRSHNSSPIMSPTSPTSSSTTSSYYDTITTAQPNSTTVTTNLSNSSSFTSFSSEVTSLPQSSPTTSSTAQLLLTASTTTQEATTVVFSTPATTFSGPAAVESSEFRSTTVSSDSAVPPISEEVPRPISAENSSFLLLIGGKDESGQLFTTSELIGSRRPSALCQSLATWSPDFQGHTGSAYLAGLDAVLTCGYSEEKGQGGETWPATTCYIFYKSWGQWITAGPSIQKLGLYGGAYLAWHNRLVSFGGIAVINPKRRIMHRAAAIFDFRTSLDLEDAVLTDDEDYVESSGDLVDIKEERLFRFLYTDGSSGAVDQYGPGVAMACAISMEETMEKVTFLLTGGINEEQLTLDRAAVAQIVDQHGVAKMLGQLTFTSSLNHARREHGCSQVGGNGDPYYVVAGGLDVGNRPLASVEAWTPREGKWRILGELQHPRTGFPSVGQFAASLFVIGGKIGSQATALIEEWTEEEANFRQIQTDALFGEKSLLRPRYKHAGIRLPYSWC